MILFYDTETTGFVYDQMPPDHDCQPYIVQLACLLTEDDGTERSHVNLVVKAAVPIPEAASKVHGITTEIAERCGVSQAFAAATWCRMATIAKKTVAHNVKFDMAVMNTAILRSNLKHPEPLAACTMIDSTYIVNLPPTPKMLAAGMDRPKSPKLEEAIKYFFDEDLDGAHDALVDVRACARLYFRLQSMKVSP